MILQELHYELKLKLDKVDSLAEKNFKDWELDWILNEAAKVLMKRRYGLTNIYRTGFEGIQKRYDDLRTLHIKSPTARQPAVVPVRQHGDFYEVKISDFAFPYYFLTRLNVDITKGDCSKTSSVRIVQHDDLDEALSNPFYNPSFEWGEVLATFGRTDEELDSEGSIYIYTDGTFSIDRVYPEYLKAPNRMWIGTYNSLDGSLTVGDPTVECDLPEHLQNELVDVAKEEIARIIEHPTFYQLSQQKLQTNE